jgi:soluble P-type ATPase
MIEITIPGADTLRLDYLVADFNGTLAVDGVLLPGVADALWRLADLLDLHVVTADTHHNARNALTGLPCELVILPDDTQDEAKWRYVQTLGAPRCVCIGNGCNDHLMLAAAGLGIAVMQDEGASVKALLAADVAATDINTAFDLLFNPQRLVATLRL